ncbi:MAG: glycoside hydrolase family 2 protein [Puniceicoccaceae bacterium]|nr:MAG: glycoside hydrolase family 2 protein [Puniceicoccaceae bacterium]
MQTLDLSGTWSLRDASAPELVYSAPVPGSVHDALLAAGKLPDAHQGYNEREQMWVGDRTWIYTREFDLGPGLLVHEHIDLVAEGLDTFCTIRINGRELAQTDNMLRPWRFGAKALLRPGRNEIDLTFSPATGVMRAGTEARHLPAWNEYEPLHIWGPVGRGYVRKQACQFGWDWGPQCPSAGPWLPLRLEAWSVARIEDWRMEQKHLPDGSVEISLYTKPSTGADLIVSASFSLEGKPLATVEEGFWGGHEWIFMIHQPALWWPNGMGEQPLHELEIELRTAGGGILDTRRARIGLRRLELVREPDEFGRSFYFRVNGRPFFAKGSNWIPLDAHPSGQNLEPRYRRDLTSARDAHMNLLRVWGGGYFSHDVFYDLCDELGILVWQDLMFGCGTYPTWDENFLASVHRETVLQARRLRHHACLACWCGNNELEMGFTAPAWKADNPAKLEVGKMAWASYNELFERVLPSALLLADPATPYFRGSPHCAPEDGRDAFTDRSGDLHTWEIWFSEAPFENYRNYLHRFVSEFGFQGFPNAATLRACAPAGERLSLGSEWLDFRQRSQPKNAKIAQLTAEWFGKPVLTKDFARFCVLTQITQGIALKTGMEHWRRLFPRCGGATYWQLNDRWAAPTWATLDFHGRWKASHHLVRRIFAPLAVIGIEDAKERTVTAYVVNDAAEPRTGEFHLILTTCAGEEIGRVTRMLTAAPDSAPTLVESFALDRLAGAPPAADDLLVWLSFAPDGCGQAIAENLMFLAPPAMLRLQRPTLAAELQPGNNPGDSLLTLRSSAVPALWVHLERPENIPASLAAVSLDEEFFHLPPHSSRTVRLRHPGRSAPALEELPLLTITDYLE